VSRDSSFIDSENHQLIQALDCDLTQSAVYLCKASTDIPSRDENITLWHAAHFHQPLGYLDFRCTLTMHKKNIGSGHGLRFCAILKADFTEVQYISGVEFAFCINPDTVYKSATNTRGVLNPTSAIEFFNTTMAKGY
jgi:hypothetical protein